MPPWLHHPVAVTIVLLFVLGAVFMRGFSDVIGVAVVIVAVYLALNAVVIAKALADLGLIRSCCRDGARRLARSSEAR